MKGNKEKLIEAAAELFHLRGYQATGLEEILSVSGVCRSNFYYHFTGKEELARMVLLRKIRETEERVLEPTLGNAGLPPSERILQFFAKMIEICDREDLQKGCIFGNMTLELHEQHHELRQTVSAFFQRVEESLQRTFTELAHARMSDGLAAADAATAVLALLQGSILLAKGHRQTGPLHSGYRLLRHLIGTSAGPEAEPGEGISYGERV